MDDQAVARSIAFDFRFTRYPKDGEPMLSESLRVIPGYDPAPLQESDVWPETKQTVDRAGYVAPKRHELERGEFMSFYEEMARTPGVLQTLADEIDQAFDAWEENRSGEVVYRVDGLQKFLQRLVIVDKGDQSPEIRRFLNGLGSDSDSFAQLVRNTDRIPVPKFLLNDRSQTHRNPLSEELRNQDPKARWPALRAGWWVRLAYVKLYEQFLEQQQQQPPPRHLDLRLLWTRQLCDTLQKSLYDTTQSKEKAPIMMNKPGQADNTRTIRGISNKQLTYKVNISASKLDLWEYMASLAQFHFESEIVDRKLFLDNMLWKMEQMHAVLWPPPRREALPLCMCFQFVRFLAGFAPHMSEEHLKFFWKLATRNIRILHWTSASQIDKEDVRRDPVYAPFLALLEDIVEFVQAVTAPATFRAWERNLAVPRTLAQSPRGPNPSFVRIVDEGATVGTFPVATALEPVLPRHQVLNVRSGKSGGCVRVRYRRALDAQSNARSASNSPVQQVSSGETPGPGPGPGPGTPAPLGTPSGSQTPGPGFGAGFPSSAEPTGPESQGYSSGSNGGGSGNWDRFQVISNTRSLLDLLQNARKVRRPTLRATASSRSLMSATS